jgi:hypothetical protein
MEVNDFLCEANVMKELKHGSTLGVSHPHPA